MRKTAFTLAELLIALVIVGVIAALTLPNIMRLNQEAGIGPMLASVQTSVEEAAGRMLVDNPNKTLAKMDAEGSFIGYLNRQLAMLNRLNDPDPNARGYALTNGAILNFQAPTGTVPAGTAFKDVVVDINGENRPNVTGLDKFTFTLSSNGFLAPQGCAKVIADNNWKVPKNYDPAACKPTDYDNKTPGGPTSGGEDCELPNIKVGEKCCNPSTDPSCKFTTPSCEETTCDTETEVWSDAACGCIKVKKRCPDGSIIDINASCESGGCTETPCEDSDIQDFDLDKCQCVTVRKRCSDGSIIPLNDDCPVAGCDEVEKQQCLDNGGTFDDVNCVCIPPTGCSQSEKQQCLDNGGTFDDVNCVCIPPTGCSQSEKQQCLNNGGTFDDKTCECTQACEKPKKGCSANYKWSQENCKCLLQPCPPGQFYTGGTCKYPENVIDVENDILFDTGSWGYDGVQALRNQLNDSTYKGLVKDYFKMYLTDQNTSYACSDYNEWFETTYSAVTEELVAASGLQNGTSAMRSLDAWNHVMERMIQRVGTKRNEWMTRDPDIELVDTRYMYL